MTGTRSTAVMAAFAAALVVAIGATAAATSSGESGNASGSGRSLFRANCGSCHTLAAAGTRGTYGPNLDRAFRGKAFRGRKGPARIRRAVKRAIAKGPDGMPAGILDGDEAAAVASYVAKVARRR